MRLLFFLSLLWAALFSTPLAAQAGHKSAQERVTTFEMRCFTKDAKADGITDFRGETEWLDTEGRVEALGKYADYASKFWGDPGLDTPLFTDSQVNERLSGIKPQPLPSVRRVIPLEEWRAYGHKEGKAEAVAQRWSVWTASGARISDGCLVLDGAMASPPVKPLDWRFRMKVSLQEKPSGLKVSFMLESGETVDFEPGALEYFEIYGDLVNNRIFLSSKDATIKEVPASKSGGTPVVKSFSIGAPGGKASVESISLYGFEDHQKDDPRTPYWLDLIFDEDFEAVPQMDGWQTERYDDSSWELVRLPSAHGGEKASGESWYLRTRVQVGDFEYASLEIEALDPGGEVWVNGEPVTVVSGHLPLSLDVREYLRPDKENTIAVRVKPYLSDRPVFHAPNDHNYGWFLGRASLVLTPTSSHILETLTHTLALDSGKAIQHHKVTLRNETHSPWAGSVEIKYFPWFPEEGALAGTASGEIELRPMTDIVLNIDLAIDNPSLWSPYDPRLYKVEVLLKDSDGRTVDDLVTTTGIRLIEQSGGGLFVNGKPEMLNGAQIFGFRLPLENVAVTIRCPEDRMVMKDLMMAKALGNTLRIHVHAETDVTEGINDPRFSEYADQLGLYLIWQTAGWIREGEVWNVDIENYPVYMREVFNHPSIVMWEASNHPNQFKKHDFSDTDDYFTRIISTIAGTDSSRLISPTSFWQHSHYGNYYGTVDYKGNPLPANPWLRHRMMTRGSQDSYAGYDHDWSHLRNIPYPWAKSCLDAKELCYFNFEHEESIAQPNWELARKEPWYKISSYEKDYEKASIGRLLDFDEWRAGQGYQAFSAWESMKMQTLCGVCGFSWCSLESGPNMFTYQKPLVDPFLVPKLAFHANKMVFQTLWAGSGDVDTVYGPGDMVSPVIFNLGAACRADLTVELQNEKGKALERKVFRDIEVPQGRSVTRLEPFRFRNRSEGCLFIVYKLDKNN